jgi:thiamine kinase-like enzyme
MMKELVSTMAGAVQGSRHHDSCFHHLLTSVFLLAHAEAFEKAQILHHDISAGNIIISDHGGLLIDWDLKGCR